MPRTGRLYIPGGLFHVLGRGIEKKIIFANDADKADFISRLKRGLDKTGHQCYAWALMDNHYHLLLRQSQFTLSDLMGPLLGGYALCYNKRHRRAGYLYQGRYQSILCEENSYFLELVRYIHLNPLKAHMVENLKALERYPWTGHAAVMGQSTLEWQSCDEVLALFSDKRRMARERYKEFVARACNNAHINDCEGGGLARSPGGQSELQKLQNEKNIRLSDERILGSEAFVQSTLAQAEAQYKKKIALRRSWDIDQLIQKVCQYFELAPEALNYRGRKNRVSYAKAVIAYFGCCELGISTIEMAQYLKISHQGVSKAIKRGEAYIKVNEITIATLSC